ncbi:hypothetical protein [Williamsia herbipolensis]|uniref:hypothetical protein n=1 Tax=Williamsia herbipolensis TaxID=1603258 RepID=UPI0005F7AE48|nr:hypothetical protein [Williamsia herbipolensis]
MAGKTKAAGALEAYRREIISDGIEQRIAELSEAVAAYEANRADRKAQERELASRQERDEDAVLAAFEEAKAAGAKPSALANIGLRPETALASARARTSKKNPAPASGSDAVSAIGDATQGGASSTGDTPAPVDADRSLAEQSA